MIFELASTSGGTTVLSSAEIYMGGSGGTPVQKACGFKDSSEDMYSFLMMAGGPLADEAKVRAYVDGSVDHFHWLVKMGVPYKNSFFDERNVYVPTDDCLLYTRNEKVWPFVEKAKPCPRGPARYLSRTWSGPVHHTRRQGGWPSALRGRSTIPAPYRVPSSPGSIAAGRRSPSGIALRSISPVVPSDWDPP